MVGEERWVRVTLWTLLLLAALHRVWNAWTIAPLTGYDAPGHAGYMLTILRDHRLPHPTEGWSTFHPPLYYLLGAGVWAVLDPLGPQAVLFGIRMMSVVLSLVAGLITFVLVRRCGGRPEVALVATALALFVPANQMAATMLGNEAFAAGVAALGLPALLRLQADPSDRGAAIVAGLVAGLACVSKFTGVAFLAACAVPFLRAGYDRRRWLAAVALAIAFAIPAAPPYLRNVALAGSPFPLTRTRDPMFTAERIQIIRPRQLLDYVRVYPDCILRPSVFHVRRLPGSYRNKNWAMTSVPGLLYASLWWDAFAHRVPLRLHRDGVWSGPTLAVLGLVPTLLTALGFAIAGVRVIARRLRSLESPLVVMALVGVAAELVHTWAAQSTAAVKGSYLLQLAPAAGVFFAIGVGAMGRRLRMACLGVSLVAVVASAFVFTEGVVFRSHPPGAAAWKVWGRQLPGSHIGDAVNRLIVARPDR